MPLEHQPPAPTTLRELVEQLVTGDGEPQPEGEAWEQMIVRIHVMGRVHRITEETYDYFLDVLPPRWMSGSRFAFAEGPDPLQLFWIRRPDAGRRDEHFTRCLSDKEIDLFCRLSRLPRDYGAY